MEPLELELSSCETPSVEATKQILALLKTRKHFDHCDISLALVREKKLYLFRGDYIQGKRVLQSLLLTGPSPPLTTL